MSFYSNLPEESRHYYTEMLSVMGALSRLFSESNKPYLDSRVTENLFCRCLQAENIARFDCTADAKIVSTGVGIKTWTYGSGLQKIAEFNRLRPMYKDLRSIELATKLASFRNDRIATTMAVHGLTRFVYHCTVRNVNSIMVYECPLVPIDVEAIRITKDDDKSLAFEDGINAYNFQRSKSVLMKRFTDMELVDEIPVTIVDDPFEILQNLFIRNTEKPSVNPKDRICLALYSMSRGQKVVHAKSGINIRFANGRKRDPYEVYIPIPAKVRYMRPDFFPPRDTPFTLKLPNGTELSAKVCQDDGKALMSNPNKALGKWLLEDVLNLAPDEPLTYDKLSVIGVDSVFVDKVSDSVYTINFAKIKSYEQFLGEDDEYMC